jgi:hypothetical protein
MARLGDVWMKTGVGFDEWRCASLSPLVEEKAKS